MKRTITVFALALILAITPTVTAYAADNGEVSNSNNVRNLLQYIVNQSKTDCSGNSYNSLLNFLFGKSCTPAPGQSAAPTVTPKPTATATPKPTATAITTPKPASTATPKPTVTATLTPTPKPTSTPVPTSANSTTESKLEASMLGMINQERSAAGLSQLKASDALYKGARAHTLDMSNNNFFSHVSPSNGSFSNRLKAAGISSASGENIALYGSVEKAHAALMLSEGHRANILGKSYTHAGIAIVYNQTKNGYYITQWFGKMN